MPIKTVRSYMRKSKNGKPCKVRSYAKSTGRNTKRKNSSVYSKKATKLFNFAASYSKGADVDKHKAKRALHLSEAYDAMAKKSRRKKN